MAAAAAAANNARNDPGAMFGSSRFRASQDSVEGPFRSNSMEGQFRSRPRRASALLEDLAEVLPPTSEWLKDISVKKLSQKGKWEDRRLVVTEDTAYVARSGRVLEAIPLGEIRHVKTVEPRDPQNTLTAVGKNEPVYTARGELSREASFPSLRRESTWKEEHNWKKSKIVKMVSSASRRNLADLDDMESETQDLCFELVTRVHGEFSGRSFIYMCETSSQKADVMAFLREQIAADAKRRRNQGMFRRWQKRTRHVYESFPFQISVALLIVAAFVIQVWESETFPEKGTPARNIIDSTDFMLTSIFTIELALNMFSFWFWAFFENPWNLFDMAIVITSIVSLILSEVPGLGALRLMRTFRVLRLFGRLHSFRRIISALGAALIPVTTAFTIVLLMVSVFAIMGVFLFQTKAPEFFGSFSASFFTMFTISTVDGWVDVVYVAAPETLDWGKVYFIAYIVVVVWTLLPVVVAVLLDKFTEVMAKDKDRVRRARMPAFKPVTSSVLDPILKTLTDFESDDNLSERIRLLFTALDPEGKDSLTFSTLSESLRTLRMGKSVHISEEDFVELTHNRTLCDSNGGLSSAAFEQVVRAELRDYLQRGLAGELLKCEENSMSAPILSSLKLLLLPDGLACSRQTPMPQNEFHNNNNNVQVIQGGGMHATSMDAFASMRNPLQVDSGELGSGSGEGAGPEGGAHGESNRRQLSRYSPVPVPNGPNGLTDRLALVGNSETLNSTAPGEQANLPGQVSEGEDVSNETGKVSHVETSTPVLPVSVEPESVTKAPVALDEAEGTRELGRGADAIVGAEEDRAEVRELARTMKQMEVLLQGMLQGQQRLESKVDKLDGELRRLSQGHAQVTGAVSEIQKKQTEIQKQADEIQRMQSAEGVSTQGVHGSRTCDICQDEKAKTIVGRASVCQLCASLLTDGQM